MRIYPHTISATFQPDNSSNAQANALRTMEALERHRGHFYNWYDTQSLKPLPPLYISSVDSGNLAGHLLTLRQGLLALPDDNILGARLFDGLSDTLRVLVDVAGGSAPAQLAQLQKEMELADNSQPPPTLAAARLRLERLAAAPWDRRPNLPLKRLGGSRLDAWSRRAGRNHWSGSAGTPSMR